MSLVYKLVELEIQLGPRGSGARLEKCKCLGCLQGKRIYDAKGFHNLFRADPY